jgi:hypothetical protein
MRADPRENVSANLAGATTSRGRNTKKARRRKRAPAPRRAKK